MTTNTSAAPRNLTDVFVRGYKNTSKKRIEVRDTTVIGLVLRITPKNTKSFSLHTRTTSGHKVQITIGRYPVISLKEARAIAMEHLANIKRGHDPREQTRLAKAQAEAHNITLNQLLDEAQAVFGLTRSMWRSDNRPGRKKPEARAAIENVFAPLLQKPLGKLTVTDFSKSVRGYKPKRPKKGKASANGAASRALAYLRPVFDWASGRGRFVKENAGRNPKLDLPDLSTISDPSIDDPTLEFKRERVLSQDELGAVLPLLIYPAPFGLRQELDPRDDYGPIAFRFLFLTLSRVEEVSGARRKDFDLRAGTWTKAVKTRRKPGSRGAAERRQVTIPLSDDAIALLLSLPSFLNGGPEDFVFPSSRGGRLCNWDRTQETINYATGTSGWHRHDLRRTGATILKQLGIAPAIIDTLLCHVNPLNSEKVSSAAANYIIDEKILHDAVDYERVAVNRLAEAVASICKSRPSYSKPPIKSPDHVSSTSKMKPSPWATQGL